MDRNKFDDLTKSIDWSQQQLEYPRTKYRELIKLSTGKHYARGGSNLVQPVNFLKLAEKIHVQLLAPRAPRAIITTRNPLLKPAATDLELAVNMRIQEMNLVQILRDWVMEAIYSMGIIKCGLAGYEYGESFADIVRIDQYFCDMSADHWGNIQYEGNDYWMNYEDFKEAEWIKPRMRSKLQPDEYTLVSAEGETKPKSISADSNPVLFKDKIHLRDAWLPDERRMVTYAVSSKDQLADERWDEDVAPEHGPYHKLIYSSVPGGNLLPQPPASLWRDLHELDNALFRKLAKQADIEKTIPTFPGGSEEDVENFRGAKDGEGIATSGSKPENVSVGGVNQVTLAFFLQCKQLSSYFADNLDTVAGLDAMTETVGQERLLSASANATMSDMSSRTIAAMRELLRSIAHYEFNDPVIQRVLEKPIPGTDLTISVPWYAARRQGKFSDYDLGIDVYSLQDDSPQAQLQRLNVWLERFVMPLYPAIQQAGGQLDVEELVKIAAKNLNIKSNRDIIYWAGSAQSGQNATSGGAISAPQITERTYNRRSVGQGQQNPDAAMMQALMGAQTQGR